MDITVVQEPRRLAEEAAAILGLRSSQVTVSHAPGEGVTVTLPDGVTPTASQRTALTTWAKALS